MGHLSYRAPVLEHSEHQFAAVLGACYIEKLFLRLFRPRMQGLIVHRMPVNARKQMHQPISESATHPRQFLQPLAQHGVPEQQTRSLQRDKFEIVRDFARSCRACAFNEIASRRRKEVEMLFAHLKRIIGISRLRLRGPSGAKDAFTLSAIAQNPRKMAKLCPTTVPATPIG